MRGKNYFLYDLCEGCRTVFLKTQYVSTLATSMLESKYHLHEKSKTDNLRNFV